MKYKKLVLMSTVLLMMQSASVAHASDNSFFDKILSYVKSNNFISDQQSQKESDSDIAKRLIEAYQKYKNKDKDTDYVKIEEVQQKPQITINPNGTITTTTTSSQAGSKKSESLWLTDIQDYAKDVFTARVLSSPNFFIENEPVEVMVQITAIRKGYRIEKILLDNTEIGASQWVRIRDKGNSTAGIFKDHSITIIASLSSEDGLDAKTIEQAKTHKPYFFANINYKIDAFQAYETQDENALKDCRENKNCIDVIAHNKDIYIKNADSKRVSGAAETIGTITNIETKNGKTIITIENEKGQAMLVETTDKFADMYKKGDKILATGTIADDKDKLTMKATSITKAPAARKGNVFSSLSGGGGLAAGGSLKDKYNATVAAMSGSPGGGGSALDAQINAIKSRINDAKNGGAFVQQTTEFDIDREADNFCKNQGLKGGTAEYHQCFLNKKTELYKIEKAKECRKALGDEATEQQINACVMKSIDNPQLLDYSNATIDDSMAGVRPAVSIAKAIVGAIVGAAVLVALGACSLTVLGVISAITIGFGISVVIAYLTGQLGTPSDLVVFTNNAWNLLKYAVTEHYNELIAEGVLSAIGGVAFSYAMKAVTPVLSKIFGPAISKIKDLTVNSQAYKTAANKISEKLSYSTANDQTRNALNAKFKGTLSVIKDKNLAESLEAKLSQTEVKLSDKEIKALNKEFSSYIKSKDLAEEARKAEARLAKYPKSLDENGFYNVDKIERNLGINKSSNTQADDWSNKIEQKLANESEQKLVSIREDADLINEYKSVRDSAYELRQALDLKETTSIDVGKLGSAVTNASATALNPNQLNIEVKK